MDNLRNKNKVRGFLLLGSSLFIALLVAEFSLKNVFKVVPGIHNMQRSYTTTDSLFLMKGFYADSEGLFRVAPSTIEEINDRLADKDLRREGHLFNTKYEVDEIYTVTDEMRDIIFNKEKNQFASVYQSILHKTGEWTGLDSAIVYFVHHPVNDAGYCGIPLKEYNGGKKKILLIGDSFTWGRTVKNITSAFGNELLAKGYTVYNTGISGADPPQYLALARKYIPLLKPDVVIVNFAMGSDIMDYRRQLIPYEPIFYRTNAGYLFSRPQGVFLGNAQETYDFIKVECSIPQTSVFNKFCSLTAVGTILWRGFFLYGLVQNKHPEHQAYWDKVKSMSSDIPYSNADVREIQKVAAENGARSIVVAIPDLRNGGACDPKTIPHFFENINYIMSPIKKEGYSLSDGHFNDLGHKQYADFLDSLISR